MPFLKSRAVHQWARVVWQGQGLKAQALWVPLVPLSLLLSFLVRGRRFLYAKRLLPVKRFPLKVLSVGNLTVGGTGKTPTVLWLAGKLKARGYRVGIAVRGYRGRGRGVQIVGGGGPVLASTEDVGDEAVMLARSFAGVVLASRDRAAAARLAWERFSLEVLILDDGFQHCSLYRDLDLLLWSGSQGIGNGWVLPAGPLREPLDLAKQAHLFLLTKGGKVDLTRPLKGIPPSRIFHGDLRPRALVVSLGGVWQERPLRELAGKRVLALSGIADPESFHRLLQEGGAFIHEVLEFPDHHTYAVEEWRQILALARCVDLIVTTEKDLVKLEKFPFAQDSLMALRVVMEVEEGERLIAEIERRIKEQQEAPQTQREGR